MHGLGELCVCVWGGGGGGGGNSNFPTNAVDVDEADQLPRMEKKDVNRANREPYLLGLLAVTIMPFTVITRLKEIILGRQPLYTVPASSTVGTTPAMNRLLAD